MAAVKTAIADLEEKLRASLESRNVNVGTTQVNQPYPEASFQKDKKEIVDRLRASAAACRDYLADQRNEKKKNYAAVRSLREQYLKEASFYESMSWLDFKVQMAFDPTIKSWRDLLDDLEVTVESTMERLKQPGQTSWVDPRMTEPTTMERKQAQGAMMIAQILRELPETALADMRAMHLQTVAENNPSYVEELDTEAIGLISRVHEEIAADPANAAKYGLDTEEKLAEFMKFYRFSENVGQAVGLMLQAHEVDISARIRPAIPTLSADGQADVVLANIAIGIVHIGNINLRHWRQGKIDACPSSGIGRGLPLHIKNTTPNVINSICGHMC